MPLLQTKSLFTKKIFKLCALQDAITHEQGSSELLFNRSKQQWLVDTECFSGSVVSKICDAHRDICRCLSITNYIFSSSFAYPLLACDNFTVSLAHL